MSLADYIAKNYLTADAPAEKRIKKRKKKDKSATATGINIADDDDGSSNRAPEDDDLELGPQTISGRSCEFRRAKTNNWTTVGAPPPSNAEQAAADAIIASTAAENNARNAGAEEDPQVLEESDMPAMESGARAGLQSAEQVTAALERKKAQERRRFELDAAESTGKGQETIYRDASGRIINVAMKRAEARHKAQEEEAKKAAELEASKGDVQRAEAEMRKQRLADAKYMNVARYADDTDLNNELKERDRWNDPAAQFLTKKKTGKSVSGKPLYQKAAPPNRYGIRPGYRWDGVDRGNGFEKEYFAAQNRRQNAKDLSYAWQMDE